MYNLIIIKFKKYILKKKIDNFWCPLAKKRLSDRKNFNISKIL